MFTIVCLFLFPLFNDLGLSNLKFIKIEVLGGHCYPPSTYMFD